MAPPPAGVMVLSWQRPQTVELIGCGGTGARLAELLARMIVGHQMPAVRLRLWDGDRVEQANITRQNFEPHEIGANKAQALALRLSGRLGVAVEAVGEHLAEESLRFSAKDEDGYTRRQAVGAALNASLVITCTDNLPSRRLVGRVHNGWWLDVGNGLSSGQAVLGNTHAVEALRRYAWDWGNRVIREPQHEDLAPALARSPRMLGNRRGWGGRVPPPAPTYQVDPLYQGLAGMHRVDALPDIVGVDPSLMRSRKAGPVGPSCAAMPFSVQGFGVNEMAALAAAALAKALMVDGRLTFGAVFFDAAAGRMTPRPITKDWYELHTPAKAGKDGGQ